MSDIVGGWTYFPSEDATLFSTYHKIDDIVLSNPLGHARKVKSKCGKVGEPKAIEKDITQSVTLPEEQICGECSCQVIVTL